MSKPMPISIPTAAEQAERYAMMRAQVTGQGYRGDVVPLRAARLTLAELRPVGCVLALPAAWDALGAVWVDRDGTLWPQTASVSLRVGVLEDVTRRAIERENKEVLHRLARGYLAGLS